MNMHSYMKRLALLLFVCMAAYSSVQAQAKSEEELMTRLLQSLQTQNSSVHTMLFPSFDTLMAHLRAQDPAAVKTLLANPARLQKYDPVFNADIATDYETVVKKGKDSSLHWNDMIMARYELERMIVTRDIAGIDKIMTRRMQGHYVVEDMLTRRRYVITMKDIMEIKGKWYGGHMVNVLPADNIEEYYEKLAIERKVDKMKMLGEMYGTPEQDTTAASVVSTETKNATLATKPTPERTGLEIDTDDFEEEADRRKGKKTKEIIERKLYVGTFDKHTNVELYIRGYKGPCPETVCYWDAIYKFEDMDEYIKLEVAKLPDGTWQFTEEPDIASMELSLDKGRLKGEWMSNKDKTEYTIDLNELKEITSRKLFMLDDVIDNELWAQ
jgi:hypothetical protein